MITGNNESNVLIKDISSKCKCKFDSRKCNSNQKWNNYKFQWECKRRHICEKTVFGILLHAVAKMANI